MKGDLWKTAGNSYFGKCSQAIERHMNTCFKDDAGAGRAVNNHLFRRMDEVSTGTYEVSTSSGT
jgi:hypothetical protein